MSLADVTSARSSPSPEGCPDCDTSASVTSDLHKYQVACTCKPGSVQYACAEEPGPPPPAKTDTPPALPPRPANTLINNRRNNSSTGCANEPCRRRKYAWWCVGCGALAAALGGLLAAQHILLRAYTASPQHLETVPAAVPAAMLVLTGVCIMSLARRRNRYSYMIKVVGACCLACALTCVLVTITTTVIHMNKLQTLKYCEYTKLTSTCTCFSMPPETHNEEEGIRCVFEGVTNCSVVHGALYWCLRGVFALSVTAVLVCIFSCMLAYQLLSHERKKMYWEQLELRCRSLYRPPSGQTAQTTRQTQNTCSCCTQCHPPQPSWDISLQHRFWAPGRIGNLYSPNPGAGRKTSAWSWFPWPRSNSQNSRCRMNGVPQSGDSAYGFCDETSPNPNPTQNQTYDERTYPTNYPQPYPRTQPVNPNLGTLQSTYPNSGTYPANSGTYPANAGTYPANAGTYPANAGSFPAAAYAQGYQEGFGESSGSYDAQTGVWGPPPPYSPQGRSGSRHHLHHPDPATATLLHHHMDVHRNSALIHDHQLPNQSLHCRNSYLLQPLQDQLRLNAEMARMNPELAHLNPELVRMNPELARLNPELVRMNPELVRLNPEMAHLAQIYPPDELARLQVEMARLGSEGRFSTLRGHLVPYRNCPRSLGLSTGNLRDCRLEDNLTVECLHQKSTSKVSDLSSDSGPKLGKENLGFQNDKNSPIRSSMQDCHRNPNAESEVYFADVSSCCNVSVKADCCLKPNLSLVGTIENHPESTSESDTGSFTLSRSQRPQPQVGSKRRPKPHEKHVKEKRHDANSSLRLTEQQIDQLNNSMNSHRVMMSERELSERIVERMNERMQRIDSRDRLNDSRIESRMNDSRISDSRMNDSRMSDRLNDSRLSDRLNESRMIERMNESRLSERKERFEDRRISDLNASFKEGSPKMSRSPLRMRSSPKNLPLEHLRQSSSDSNKGEFSGRQNQNQNHSPSKEFFINTNLPTLSPISPNTEESLISDEEENKPYANEPESSKCLGPDAQYEKVRNDKDESLKMNHNRCCSDSNTMDSGWQSGSEKQVTD